MKRDAKKIKIWMLIIGLREIDIVREIGVKQPTVNRTLNGTRNNKDVLKYLVEKGCPENFLGIQ